MARISATDPAKAAAVVARATATQEAWGSTRIHERLLVIRRWWGILGRDADAWARAIRVEVGEAMAEVSRRRMGSSGR